MLDGKFFLLCTDGLSKEVSERSIEQALLPGICSLACARDHNERTRTLQRQIRRDRAGSRRGRRTEELIAQSGALALVTNLVMAWNTHHMQATLDHWRAQGRQIDPQILHHITPMGFRGAK